MDVGQIARDGVFSTADAARAGLDSNALRRLVRQGRCLRLTRGWFAVHDGAVIEPQRCTCSRRGPSAASTPDAPP